MYEEQVRELEECHNIEVVDLRQTQEYNPQLAQIIGQTIVHINEQCSENNNDVVNVGGSVRTRRLTCAYE